jgi:hypothetical protein
MNLYVYNSPLQYFLCRLIQTNFNGDAALGIQYTDCGDFSDVFTEIDALMGVKPMQSIKFGLDNDLSHIGPVDRLFSSNRFNPSEVEIYLKLRKATKQFCAFEDGLSLYVDYSSYWPEWIDNNHRTVAKNTIKLWMRNSGLSLFKSVKPYYLGSKVYDEYHSIFPDIPGRRLSSKWISLAPALRNLEKSGSICDPLHGALILSQSRAADDFASADEYLSFISLVINDLLQNNSTVYFKQHPRDPDWLVNELTSIPGCKLLPPTYQRVPVEILLAQHPAITPYGFWSSSLAYASGGLLRKAYTFAPAYMSRIKPSCKLLSLWTSREKLLRKYAVSTYTPNK